MWYSYNIFSIASNIFSKMWILKIEFVCGIKNMNKIEAHKSPVVIYHKCLIYRVLCHWLRDQKIYVDISYISYIFHILKTSHGFVNQYYNLDIEVEMGAARPSIFVTYCALLFHIGDQRFFRIYFEWIFYHALAKKLVAQTKFEVKRHFTIRIADTRRIKFVFFPYQYLQNFSVSDQNPGVATYL